jgi:hypothetical protein
MARLIHIPYLASLVLVRNAAEIDDLVGHPALARSFRRGGGLVNRLLVRMIDRQMRYRGDVLPAFLPRDDASRAAGQQRLLERLSRIAVAGDWPHAPVVQMARYVATGRERREAHAALAYAVAAPYLPASPTATRDDAYRPLGRHLWGLYRRLARARRPLSPLGFLIRLVRADRRAREKILDLVGRDAYGLHAVEVTLANGDVILEAMRDIVAELPAGATLTEQNLAWAAIRTAPETIVRQTANFATLPHVKRRVPPDTIVLLSMRRALEADAASGYEFASRHWSHCPAASFVRGLFGAVAAATLVQVRGEGQA